MTKKYGFARKILSFVSRATKRNEEQKQLLVIKHKLRKNKRSEFLSLTNKSLLDILPLITPVLIPLTVLGVTLFFNKKINDYNERSKDQDEIKAQQHLDETQQAQREQFEQGLLDEYLNRFTNLALDKELLDPSGNKQVLDIARIHTLVTLQSIKPERKRVIFQLLYESGLLLKNQRAINLDGANFSQVILSDSTLNNISLNGANLAGANLSNVSLKNTDLRGIILNNDSYYMTYMPPVRENISHVAVNYYREAILTDSDLSGSDLSDSDLTNANLTNANLTKAVLSNSNLSNSNLSNSNLSNSNLSNSNLSNSDLTSANLTKANLSGAHISRTIFFQANLTDVDLSRLNLSSNFSDLRTRWDAYLLEPKNSITLCRTVLPSGKIESRDCS